MAKKKRLSGSAKRFGSRYGRSIREKVAKIEKTARMKHKCPYCNKTKVRRLSVGIWGCQSCGSKFTGQAYTPILRAIAKPKIKGPEDG
ncbi:MAG: 50S ribosomal protein L37ae [Candidatus Woesearchaeota archaeon]